MEKLLDQMDNDDNEEIGGKYEPEEENNTGLNIYDQFDQKYDVTLPNAVAEEPIVDTLSHVRINEEHAVMEDDNFKENEGNITVNSSELARNEYRETLQDVEMDFEDHITPARLGLNTDTKGQLHINENGTISMFWYDAHEDFSTSKEVFLFGKSFDPTTCKYSSVCVTVRGISRVMYVVPKPGVDIAHVHAEIKSMFETRFSNIKMWRSRPVNKNYCFEMPVKRGSSDYLELRYPSEFPPLPQNLSGKTFDHIFGKNTSVLETFLVQSKLMGPCWITIQKSKVNKDYKKTWCDHEIIIENPKHLE